VIRSLGPWRLDSVDSERMREFAVLLADPNPIHLEPEAVRARGLGDRVVNQGPANFGYVL
jgi:acyl dehydratase